jgi:hypothetical protein
MGVEHARRLRIPGIPIRHATLENLPCNGVIQPLILSHRRNELRRLDQQGHHHRGRDR